MVAFDLHRLRLLQELAERGTLSAVAEALGYTPSAVSQQLSVLEKEVGARLLEKAGRGVRLTDAGQLLAAHAGVLLSAAEVAASDLAALGGQVRGTVRAGGLQSVARRLLVPAVAHLLKRHPHVRVEIAEIELEQALPELRTGAMDLIIIDEYDGHPRPRPQGLQFEILLEEPLKLVLPPEHELAQHATPVRLAALQDDVWVTSAAGTGHHAMVIGTCRSLGGYDPDIRHRCSDAEIQFELVRSTGAVALLPELTLPAADASLAIRDLADVVLRRRLTIVTRRGPASPPLAAFTQAVRQRRDLL